MNIASVLWTMSILSTSPVMPESRLAEAFVQLAVRRYPKGK